LNFSPEKSKVIGRILSFGTYPSVLLSVLLFLVSITPAQTVPQSDVFERIHVGDFIEIDVIGSIEDDWRGKIDDSGIISNYPLLKNPIDVLCLTTRQVEALLLVQLKEVIRNAKVEVKVLDRSERPLVTVSGAVSNPKRFRVLRPTSLQEVIVLVGGLNEESDGSVEIIRRASLGCTDKPSSNNADLQVIRFSLDDIIGNREGAIIPITAGDIVTVKKAGFVTIIGGVRNPQQIRMKSKMTVSRAVAAAGGMTKGADISKIRVYRLSGSTTEILQLNLKPSVKDGNLDIELRAGDVIEVPIRGRKSAPFVGLAEGQTRDEAPPNLPFQTID